MPQDDPFTINIETGHDDERIWQRIGHDMPMRIADTANEQVRKALMEMGWTPPPAAPPGTMLLTMTIGIDRAGNVYEDQQNYDNPWPEVYRAMHQVRDEVDRLIRERRECPYNPKKER